MKRMLEWLLAVILLAFAACWAADNPMVGKWECISNAGQDRTWTLVVKEDAGKLSGALIGADSPDEIPLIDPKLDGDLFTFKIAVSTNCLVEAKVKVEGKKFDGTFACAEASGTLKGAKQS